MDDGRIIGGLLFLQPIWRWLRQPWVLLATGGLIILLLLIGRTIPQLPTLLANDPVATERWLRTTGQSYGASANLVQALGLFDVVHSALLRFLLLWMGLLLAVQLAEQLGIVLQLRRLPTLVMQVPGQIGAPLLTSSSLQLRRERFVEKSSPTETAVQIIAQIQPRYGAPWRHEQPLAQNGPTPDGNGSTPEIRLLWLRNLLFGYLRLLLLLGVLLALATVWYFAQRSWQIAPFLMAPGEAVRYGSLHLGFAYEPLAAESASDEQSPPAEEVTIDVQLNETIEPFVVPVRGATLRLGSVTISGELGPPGLQVRAASGERLLARPGQAGALDNVGLLFANEGDEEFVLVPQEAVALRFLRAADPQTPYFLLEIYNQSALDEGNAQPVQRLQVVGPQSIDLPTEGDAVTLVIDPHPSVRLQARSLPGLWMLWPTLVLILMGSISLWRRPSLQLVQIAPWPVAGAEGAAVVIWQANENVLIDQ